MVAISYMENHSATYFYMACVNQFLWLLFSVANLALEGISHALSDSKEVCFQNIFAFAIEQLLDIIGLSVSEQRKQITQMSTLYNKKN